MSFEPTKEFEQNITQEVIAGIVQKYFPTATLIKFSKINKGWSNSNIKIKLDSGTYVIRFFAPEHMDRKRTKSDIQYVLEFMKHLENSDIAIPKQYSPCFKSAANVYAAIFGYVSGREVSELNDDQIASLGQTVAQIHTSAEKFRPKYKSQFSNLYSLENWYRETKAELPRNHNYMKIMASLEDKIEGILDKLEEQPKSKQILIHGDLSSENMKFSGDQVAGIFDFDDCHMGTAEEDLGILIANFTAEMKPDQKTKFVDKFFEAYESIRGITPELVKSALLYTKLKPAVEQYFYNTNDILEGREIG